MPRIAIIIGALGVVALVAWQFPLFYVVPLEQAAAKRQAEAFDARAYASEFWESRLEPQFDSAADAVEVIAALNSDPDEARERFGRQVGMSRSTFFFLRGSGMISTVDKRAVGVALSPNAGAVDGFPDILLSLGPVTGSEVRDATGLLSAGDFANSQHFNRLAAELNRLVEAGPIRMLQDQAESGRQVQFVGCAVVTVDRGEPLKVIPVEIDFQ